ncbi:hypothetical protein C5688_03145 [Methylocystis sp. MitZ-2018]|nr:hypothetical protein C5688_03145 [Methylocystis sp. MitZ-2018]
MSEAERQLLLMEIGNTAEQIKNRYSGEANTLKGIAAMLNREAERIQEKAFPTPTTSPKPVQYGEENSYNLFDGDNNQ